MDQLKDSVAITRRELCEDCRTGKSKELCPRCERMVYREYLAAVVRELDDFMSGFTDFHLSMGELIEHQFQLKGVPPRVKDFWLQSKAEFLQILMSEVVDEIQNLLAETDESN